MHGRARRSAVPGGKGRCPRQGPAVRGGSPL